MSMKPGNCWKLENGENYYACFAGDLKDPYGIVDGPAFVLVEVVNGSPAVVSSPYMNDLEWPIHVTYEGRLPLKHKPDEGVVVADSELAKLSKMLGTNTEYGERWPIEFFERFASGKPYLEESDIDVEESYFAQFVGWEGQQRMKQLAEHLKFDGQVESEFFWRAVKAFIESANAVAASGVQFDTVHRDEVFRLLRSACRDQGADEERLHALFEDVEEL